MKLLLASSSPYRRELLSRLRVPFSWQAPEVDEQPLAGEKPQQLARRLSATKAQVLASDFNEHLIIGSDQVASCQGQSVNKAGNYANAYQQLQALSGQHVDFHSGLCVFNTKTGEAITDSVTTKVVFRELSNSDIDSYLRCEQPYDCAGSFKAEGLGIALLDAISSDDNTAIIGLPLIRLRQMLEEFDYQILEHLS
ncbi:MAG: septum formation protein Maf [Gammaproteobacteria bacterium]|nr:septum formation protein Maf [Gammaproteobacteria bacterium]MBQ0840126.1 septum formation protein Maf [Gammaproteobacteria bacterium]